MNGGSQPVAPGAARFTLRPLGCKTSRRHLTQPLPATTATRPPSASLRNRSRRLISCHMTCRASGRSCSHARGPVRLCWRPRRQRRESRLRDLASAPHGASRAAEAESVQLAGEVCGRSSWPAPQRVELVGGTAARGGAHSGEHTFTHRPTSAMVGGDVGPIATKVRSAAHRRQPALPGLPRLGPVQVVRACAMHQCSSNSGKCSTRAGTGGGWRSKR